MELLQHHVADSLDFLLSCTIGGGRNLADVLSRCNCALHVRVLRLDLVDLLRGEAVELVAQILGQSKGTLVLEFRRLTDRLQLGRAGGRMDFVDRDLNVIDNRCEPLRGPLDMAAMLPHGNHT